MHGRICARVCIVCVCLRPSTWAPRLPYSVSVWPARAGVPQRAARPAVVHPSCAGVLRHNRVCHCQNPTPLLGWSSLTVFAESVTLSVAQSFQFKVEVHGPQRKIGASPPSPTIWSTVHRRLQRHLSPRRTARTPAACPRINYGAASCHGQPPPLPPALPCPTDSRPL